MEQSLGTRLRPVLTIGLSGAALALLAALVGMVETMNQRHIIDGLLFLGHTVLMMMVTVTGYLAARKAPIGAIRQALLFGATTGLIISTTLTLLVIIGQAVNLRTVLINAHPPLYRLLTFSQEGVDGLFWLLLAGVLFGLAGALLAMLSARWRGPVLTGLFAILGTGLFQELLKGIFSTLGVPDGLISLFMKGLGLSVTGAVLIAIIGAAISVARTSLAPLLHQRVEALPLGSQRAVTVVKWAFWLLVLIWLPNVLGSYLAYVLVMVGLFALMGLGLNLEIGWAGLLDLGFVAFFAIGAYTVGILTSTEFAFSWTFWQAVPVAIIASLIAGVVLGVPVLGVRGDYLAIATLGFGEIVRILVLSDWLKPFTGGAQGIAFIPKPQIGPLELVEQIHIYYLVVAACIVVLFVCIRLRTSRIGRAWMAMREDEDVAQAMGINLVRSKLLAYGIGGAFAGSGGAIFATLLGSVYPHSFGMLISINVLALIIVGGMGSIPGVFVGALILVGLPELLREFAEYRLLMYGALLIAMMLIKPQGFWPDAGTRSAGAAVKPVAPAGPGKGVQA